MTRGTTLLLALLGCTLSLHAHAERPPAAAELFSRAQSHYSRGRYIEAAVTFERANRLAPHAATLHNVALSWEKADQPARAADAYELALAMKLDGPLAAKARIRLASLKRVLSYLVVDEPSGGLVTVAHLKNASVPVRLHLQPGAYVVHLGFPQGKATGTDERIELSAGETRILNFSLPSLVVADRNEALEPVPAEVPAQTLMAGDSSPRHSLRDQLGWSSVGAGAVFTGTAVFFGVRALHAREAFMRSSLTDAGARSRAASSRTLSNVSWGLATVSSAAGALLLFTDLWKIPSERGPSFQLGIGRSAMELSGTF